jgi:VanZ family protein
MKSHFSKWLPALLVMLIIFWFSAQPAPDLFISGLADKVIKKGGHMIGYGLLAFSYWRAYGFRKARWWLAWLLAVIYAVSDEFHQSFVPGRHASPWDVIIFDNLGALISLWLVNYFHKEKRLGIRDPTLEKASR